MKRLLLLLLAGCGGSEICDADELRAVLPTAGSGAPVEIGECTLAGPFVIPDGVRLQGRGPEKSKLTGTVGRVVTLGTVGAELSDVSIESSGAAGLVISGLSDATVARTRITFDDGVGLAVENVDGLRLEDVVVQGPVVSGGATNVTATHGLVLVNVLDAVLTEVVVRGAAEVGVLAVESRVEWVTSEIAENRGLGLVVEDGTVALDRTRLARTFASGGPMFAWNGVFMDGALVTSEALTVEESEGFGLLHDTTPEVMHANLEASDNVDAGVWFQGVASADLSGAFAGNGFAGIVAVESSNLSIHDVMVSNTQKRLRVLENTTGPIEVGDGVHLVDSSTEASIRDVTIVDSGRVGLLFALANGATLAAGQIANVDITVSDVTAFGALAQGGTAQPGWDAGITRTADVTARDGMAGLQPEVSLVGPCERPANTDLANLGLSSLVP